MLEVRDEAESFFQRPEASLNPRPPSSREEERLGTDIGRYRLIERIGEGGCGVVYLAEQREPVCRQVALKIIRLGMDTESVIARFEIERQTLALMDHPNIARVFDAGATASGRPYFVMELADGEKITDYCDRRKLDLDQRLSLFILVCEAIQHAHQKGVIHRDIKPSNILVREHEGRSVPKVIDFGIAKVGEGRRAHDGTATLSGRIVGTPAYMSPEQAEGSPDIDTRSDIYSLGILLYELLTGSPPLRIDSSDELGDLKIREMLATGQIEPPSTRLKAVPGSDLSCIASRRSADPQRLPSLLARDLDWIVMRALEKDRQRRYGTAHGLALDVERYLHGQPVIARPPSRWYLWNKMIRRNRGGFIAAGISLFALVGGFGTSTWMLIRERNARHEQARLRVMAEKATANEIRLREDARVADLVRQAAVLLRYGEKGEADRLLDDLPTERIPHSLEAAHTFMTVANWNLTEGNWQPAAERFQALGKVLTNVDKSDSQAISFDFLSVATAVCEWGETGKYDELRRQAIDRFADSANPVVAEHILKATLLRPADLPTLERLAPLSEVIRDSLAREEKSAHLRAWQQFSLALFDYRMGRYESTAERAKISLELASNSDPRKVSNQLLIAMAGLRSGAQREIVEPLAELRHEVDGWIGQPFQLLNSDGTLWYNQHAVLILLEEAERLSANSGS
nr:serine/threonine-protein kinase [Haloferula luteola]